MFGKKVKRLREEMQVTQKELASILDVKTTTVSMWESGRNSLPRANTYMVLLDLFQKYGIE